MGCCSSSSTNVSPEAAHATSMEMRAKHPLSAQNNPHELTVLGTPSYVHHRELLFTNAQGLRISVQVRCARCRGRTVCRG